MEKDSSFLRQNYIMEDRSMTAPDKEFVLSIFPESFCKKVTSSAGTWYVIMPDKNSDEEHTLAYWHNNEEVAWNRAKQKILKTMMVKFEQ